jgi:hypothetical protein
MNGKEKILDQLKNKHGRKWTRKKPRFGPRMSSPSEAGEIELKTGNPGCRKQKKFGFLKWFVNLLGSLGIDSQPGGPLRKPYLLYPPTMLHRLAESNLRNRFLVSLNICKYELQNFKYIDLGIGHGSIRYVI